MADFLNTNKKNTYNNSTTYSINDVVFYGGITYVCGLESTGNLPTNETYWTNSALWITLDKS